MYSKDDKKYAEFLKNTYPDIYERISEIYNKSQNDIRNGCHDLRNIATLISGNYQLVELDIPYLADNPRWLQMGSDIDSLTSALVSIGEYRYANAVKLRHTNTYEYIWQLQDELTAGDNLRPDIAMSIPPTIPPVNIDTDKITYAIKALIENITDIQSDASITLSINYDSEYLYIHIADELNSFDSQTESAIFELFNTNKQNHIGMSLATSYRILLAHNGDLSYCKNTPCGSIFTLTLPLAT